MDQNFDNGILIDYLAFTVEYSNSAMERMMRVFGDEGVEELGYGGMGYTHSVGVLDGGKILWHPERKGMGLHVRLNSKSLALIDMTPIGLLNRLSHWGATVTRADIAFDDTEGLLDIDEMHRKLLAKEVTTRFRKVLRISGAKISDGQKTGDTINVGVRTSEAFIRVYDKVLEREAKGQKQEEDAKWTRVELELKGEKADAFCLLLAGTARESGQQTPGELCRNLLWGLLDFKEPSGDDTNKTRWKTSEFWEKFVRSQGKLTVSLPKKVSGMREAMGWVEKAVSKTLAMIVLSGEDWNGMSGYDFIINAIVNGEKKITKRDLRKMDDWNDEMEQKRLV